MRIIDVSVPIRPGMITYPGDPTVELERVSAIADGALANVSRLQFGVHTGTHVDAPLHFLDGAAATEELPLDVLVGDCVVVEGIDLRGVEPGEYQLVCAPLKLVGSDGAPARVLLIANEGAADG